MIVSSVVFACHEKACAPPPAGHGGSSKGASGPTGTVRHSGVRFHPETGKPILVGIYDFRPTETTAPNLPPEITTHRGSLPITAIRPSMNYLADRGTGAQAKLDADVGSRGVIKPLKLVYESVQGKKPAYYVVDGHHRLAAAKAAGHSHVPVEVESRIGTPPHFAPKPNVGETASRWFMGPANAKGRQHGIVVPKDVADAWKAANPPKPQDTRRRVTKYH